MIAKRLLGIQKESSPPAPAATDVYYDYRSLILNMQGPAGSTTFTDDSPNNFTVSPYGNAQLAADATFGTVASFDGNGDYLLAPSSTQFNFGSGDFTVEFWTFPTSGQISTYNPCFYSQNAYGSLAWAANNAGMRIHFGNAIFGGSSFTQIDFSTPIPTGQWSHVAVSRSGNTIRVFINGTQVGSATYTGVIGFDTARPGLSISDSGVSGGREFITGRIGPLRISPWAVYKSNFTPSQDLFPVVQQLPVQDPWYDKTSLILNMQGASGSTTFTDDSPNALTVTPYGDAELVSDATFGTVASFDGSGDKIVASQGIALNDFTIECWVKCGTNTNFHNTVLGAWSGLFTTAGNWAFRSRFDGIEQVALTIRNSSGWTDITTGTSVSDGNWHHMAVVRSGTAITLYVDGVLKATATNSTQFVSTEVLTAGGSTGSTSAESYYNGLLGPTRISKGIARDPADFLLSPPSKFPTLYNPYTELPVAGAALWLDAADDSTLFTDAGATQVVKSGDQVYQWNDKSGNNRHAIQTTSANRPTWLPPASGQNGLGAVAFDGVNDSLSGDFGTTSIMNSVFTLHGVFQWTSNANTAPVFFYAGDRSTSKDRILWYYTGKGRYDQYASGVTGPDMTSNTWYRVSLTKNSLTNVTIEMNGVSVTGNVGNQNIASTLYQLASIKSEANGYAQMKWAELVIYPSTQPSGDQTLVKDYLKSKWGTP